MKHHVTQDLLGIFVVITQLGTSIIVCIRHDSVHSLTTRFLTELLGKLVGNAVHTAYSRDNPDFIADTHITVFAAVSLEGTVLMGDAQLYIHGIVGVIKQSGKVGLDLFLIDPVSLFDGYLCMSDGVTILDYLISFGKILQRDFVSGRDIFGYGDSYAVYGDGLTGLEFRYGYSHIISRVDF